MGHTQLCSRMEGGCIEKYAHVCMCVCVKEPRGRGEIHTKEEGGDGVRSEWDRINSVDACISLVRGRDTISQRGVVESQAGDVCRTIHNHGKVHPTTLIFRVNVEVLSLMEKEGGQCRGHRA